MADNREVRVYSKPDCPYCLKAKALFKSLGVEYEEIVITEKFSNWQDKLKEITGRQTVPQIYIGNMHVGGFNDLSMLATTGKLNKFLGIKADKPLVRQMFDVCIIGCGPAGMAAAIYLARKKINCAVITDDIGGQMNLTTGIENYPGYRLVDVRRLIDDFYGQVKSYNVPIFQNEEVVSISLSGDERVVGTSGGKTFTAKVLIIATGRNPRRLNVPGEK